MQNIKYRFYYTKQTTQSDFSLTLKKIQQPQFNQSFATIYKKLHKTLLNKLISISYLVFKLLESKYLTIPKIVTITSKLFPDRTLSQCKSFYCNQVKPYVFKPGNELSKENIKFTLMCYYYYITEKMPGDHETYDLRVQRILAYLINLDLQIIIYEMKIE
ncbi:Hypothetical_protein [Hexamita inflata]|uniref:Hypothetical_protein n=1 Tax=Hexamita inflata TaxID=28002 RepID=A0AA86PZJ7_9EUKA|nr:Hypothetical protein HINF_LOCUS36964 [Hexamita inflata]